MIINRFKIPVLSLLSLLGCYSFVWSVGSRGLGNQAIGAYSLSQANAVVARGEDISTNFFNPAGLSEHKGMSISAGVEFLTTQYKRTSFAGIEESAKKETFPVPNFYAGGSIADTGLFWGLGLTSPFGLSTEWSAVGFSGLIATKSRITITHLNPNVAYKVNDKLSFGAGFVYLRADADLNKQTSVAVINSVLTATLPDFTTPNGNFQQEGDGSGWGYNLGALYEPWDGHRFGVNYKGQVDLTLEGDATLGGMSGTMAALFGGSKYSTPVKTQFHFPPSGTIGYAVDLNEKWTIEADAEWTGWSVFEEQKIIYPQEKIAGRLAILNDGNPLIRHWSDVLSFGIGSQYKLNERIKVRGGYLFQDSPVPTSRFDPAVPDSDMHTLSIGLGYSITDIIIDLGYSAFIFPDRHIKNSVGTPLSDVDGRFQSFASAIMINVGYKFGGTSN